MKMNAKPILSSLLAGCLLMQFPVQAQEYTAEEISDVLENGIRIAGASSILVAFAGTIPLGVTENKAKEAFKVIAKAKDTQKFIDATFRINQLENMIESIKLDQSASRTEAIEKVTRLSKLIQSVHISRNQLAKNLLASSAESLKMTDQALRQIISENRALGERFQRTVRRRLKVGGGILLGVYLGSAAIIIATDVTSEVPGSQSIADLLNALSFADQTELSDTLAAELERL